MGFFRRWGKRGVLLRCRVLRLGFFFLGGLFHQLVDQLIVLALFRRGLLRGCRFAAALLAGFLNILLDRSRIHHRELELLHDPVGPCGVVLEYQDVDGVILFPHRDRGVENPVSLGLPGKPRAVLFFNGIDLQRAFLPQHGFNAGFALGLFLVFQNRVKGGGQIFRGCAGDLEGDFRALKAHAYHLLRRIA